MIAGFLLDEQLPGWWRREIIVHASELKVWRVGDPNAPPLESSDGLLLEWCELHDALLLTNNRRSMPGHVRDHIAAGRHMPGILTVEPDMRIEELIEGMLLIRGASLENEFQDQIRYFPRL
ncbi:MAG: hypothetical protein JNM56_11305 [Planctomycetia bacterium]|nr:hypothetical protein [Planctomycetia bacterium]